MGVLTTTVTCKCPECGSRHTNGNRGVRVRGQRLKKIKCEDCKPNDYSRDGIGGTGLNGSMTDGYSY